MGTTTSLLPLHGPSFGKPNPPSASGSGSEGQPWPEFPAPATPEASLSGREARPLLSQPLGATEEKQQQRSNRKEPIKVHNHQIS